MNVIVDTCIWSLSLRRHKVPETAEVVELRRLIRILTEDYEQAAEFFNTCRSKGLQGSNTDFLICAAAVRNNFPIYTTDHGFERYAQHLPIRLYHPKPETKQPPEEPILPDRAMPDMPLS